jgi:16S rRNA (guanine1207-N2)-methyltransferase
MGKYRRTCADTTVWRETVGEQYFAKDPSSQSHIATAVWEYGGRQYEFLTDSGVFSRGRVDFGSRLLASSLPALRGRVLDIGCGYGFIGLAAKLMNPHADVVLCDINRRALSLARENAKRLGVHAEILESDGYSDIPGKFDAIVTNPPVRAGKAVYYPWFDGAPERLNPGGALFIVLQRKQGAPSAVKRLKALFPSVEEVGHGAGYHAVAARL